MTEAAEKLKTDLLALTPEDRAELTQFLLALDEEGEPGLTQEQWDEAWSAEINRRLADLDSGKVKGVPGEEVMERLRRKFAR